MESNQWKHLEARMTNALLSKLLDDPELEGCSFQIVDGDVHVSGPEELRTKAEERRKQIIEQMADYMVEYFRDQGLLPNAEDGVPPAPA